MRCPIASTTGIDCNPKNQNEEGRYFQLLNPIPKEGTKEAAVAQKKATISRPEASGSGWGSQSGGARATSDKEQEEENAKIEAMRSRLPGIISQEGYGAGGSGEGRNKGKGRAQEDSNQPAPAEESGLKKLGKQLKKKLSSKKLRPGKK
ncbi:hypothetical protein MMC11_003449 [Xylographa trunciseda]|nr:hypothetical protein [Xylographa trunciseda]